MSDFHRSLDRALEHEEGAYARFVEAAERAVIRQDDKFVTFRVTPNIKAFAEVIDRQIAALSAACQRPADPSLPFWWDRIDPMGTE